MPRALPQNTEPDIVLPAGGFSARTRLTALIVAVALFMQNLDGTVISTALPTMARSFGADPLHMNVALTSYLLALAVFIPASGWVADRYGSRTVFRAAIFVFTLGSVLCGQATSLPFLVLARIVQGAGGAMMVPVARLVLVRTAAKSELVAAMAWVTMPGLIGPILGPPLGGFIVDWFSWPWIFDINVPIGLLGIVLVSLYIPDYREAEQPRFDLGGLGFSGVGLAALMFGCETAGRGVVPPRLTLAMLVLGVAALVGYWLHARRRARPLLDLTLFALPTFRVSVVSGSLFRFGVGATPFLLPMMLQIGFGFDPLRSGLITFATSAGALVMKPATQTLLRRLGFRNALISCGAAGALLLGATGLFRPGWPMAAIYAVLLLGGLFRSLLFAAFNTIAYADVPRARMSAATSLYSTIQQLSLTFGVTIGAASLEIARHFSGTVTPQLSDFSIAFGVVAVLALIASPSSAILPADAGAEVSGHRQRGE